MIEMAEIIDKFRRSRREFASTALSFILEAVNSKKYSIHRLFQRYDKDGSGSLNKTEFQEAMLQIGLKLDEFQVDQILAEIDFDISGSIEANELWVQTISSTRNVDKFWWNLIQCLWQQYG